MKKSLLSALTAVLCLSVYSTSIAHAQSISVLYGPGVNLLTNPGHEHPGVFFEGLGEINVAWDWVPFWEEPPPGTDLRDQNYRRPEFRPPYARDYPERVKSGSGSNRWFNYWALNKKAGVMQYVAGVPAGAPIRFTSWLQLWSSQDDAVPAKSTNDGNLQVRVCIDTDGGPRNMDDPNLVCSDWKQPYDRWEQISVNAVAKNNVVNVLIWSTAAIPVQHNDIYADESCFEILNGANDKGVCLGQGFVPTGANVQKLPPNFVDIKSALTALPSEAKKTTTVTRTVAAPKNNAPAVAVNAKNNLNVRDAASDKSNVIGKSPRGTVLTVTGKSADSRWYQVNFDGKKGWVSATLVIPNALAKSAPVVK